MNNMDPTIVVDIKVNAGTGRLSASGEAVHFTYDPSTFLCTRGDVIQWQCKQGPFALHFGERPLLGKVVIRSGAKKNGDYYETKAFQVGFREDNKTPLADGAIQQGMHKYSVAVHLKDSDGGPLPGVYIDACPSGGYEC